jgi:hypothetical protein
MPGKLPEKCRTRVGNYVTLRFPGRNTFLPTPPRKLAIYLANGAQPYATRLMRRSSIRSAHASERYRKLKHELAANLVPLLYAPVNKPADQLSLFHAGFLTNFRQGFHLRVGQPNSGSFHGAQYAIAPYVGQSGIFYTQLGPPTARHPFASA